MKNMNLTKLVSVIKFLTSMLFIVLAVSACSKDKNNSNGNRNTVGYQDYYMAGDGMCYSVNGNRPVPQSYCSNNGFNNGFNNGWNNGFNNGYGTSCYGIYIWQGQQVQCSGPDCAGYTLINAQTGITEQCL